jgi:glycosyltransferase involved in cell wall biosynthesis
MPAPDVALISPYPSLGERHGGRSGVASYAAQLAAALTERGAHVTVLAPAEDREPAVATDRGVRVERPFARGPRALVRAAAAAHETFLYGGPSSIPALAPALAGLRRAGRGVVVTMHHVVDPRAVDGEFTRVHRVRAPAAVARAGLGAVQRAILRAASAVLVHEPGFADLVPEAHVVPHGVDPAGPPPDRAAARERLSVDRDRLLVLCFGFLAPYKGLETALEGALRAGDGVHLVVAGGEHPRLQAARDGYARRLRERWGDHATFTGYVADGEVHDWFAAADVALFPYPRPFATSGPLAIALGAGTPVLLSEPLARCTGAPAPTAVAPDAASIATRLRSLATDPQERERLAAASRAMALDRAWPAVARRHLDLYAEVSA